MICIDCQTQHEGAWPDIVGFFHEACPTCSSNSEMPIGGRFAVEGSTRHEVSDYEEMLVRAEAEASVRPNRPDYWEFVIHFCSPRQFESILEEEAIFAADTGYFGVPAVCLTDAPLPFTPDIEERHGSCGFMFKKAEILRLGGGPAVYLSPSVLEAQKRSPGFSATLKPFVNIVRPQRMASSFLRKHDWLHEREWRFPRDIEFDELCPEAVVLPPGDGQQRFSVFRSAKTVIEAARRFTEIRRPREP